LILLISDSSLGGLRYGLQGDLEAEGVELAKQSLELVCGDRLSK
jgi:hypothetical protein